MAAINVIGKVFTSKPAQVVYATTGAVLVDKIVSPAVDYMRLSKEEKATLKALKKQQKNKEKALKYAEKATKYGVAAGFVQEPVETHLDNEALDIMSEAQLK